MDFIRESEDKHVFVKIEWSDKCVREGDLKIRKNQLKNVLCLFIDERSMLSSKDLRAAERNIRKTVYNGQNSQEIWGNLCGGNGVSVLPCAHPQLFKVFKHLIYV